MALIPQIEPSERSERSPGFLTPEVVKRLQVGGAGIALVVLCAGLADVATDRALEAERNAVPQAAATVEPSETETGGDPVSDAGVVPDLPAQPEAEPVPEGPVLPETGEGVPVE